LGRVINPETAGKTRKQMLRAIVIALRKLMSQSKIDQETRDLAAFIVQTLKAIAKTIDSSVAPWEKRGYWVKADRFRMEWLWAERLGNALEAAILNDNWAEAAKISGEVAEKVKDIKVPRRHGVGQPWTGAWDKLQKGR